MIDSHAHIGNPNYKNAYVCTSYIPEYDEFYILKEYRYFAVGLIPPFKKEIKWDLFSTYLEQGAEVGEIGMDSRFGNKEEQLEIFEKGLDLAKSYNKTVVIHQVGFTELIYSILKEKGVSSFILHSYTGSYEMAKKYSLIGGIISLSPRAEKCKDFNRLITLPFLTETDMVTGRDEVSLLGAWNLKLSEILGRDIAKESEDLLRSIFDE